MSQNRIATEIEHALQQAITRFARDDRLRSYVGDASVELKKQLQNRLEQDDCMLMSSGTAALEVLFRAAGIGSGDEVIISSYDYPGNFWAIERVGARPLLIDTQADSWAIDMEAVERLGDLPNCKAMVVSHLHGQLQPTQSISELCRHRGWLLIEDSCQSFGAGDSGDRIGKYADATVVSFGGGKLVSAGRGGAWLSDDERLAQRARLAAGAGSGPYAMSELQATVVLAQLPFLSRVIDQMRSYFAQLVNALKQSVSDPHERTRQGTRFIVPWESDLTRTTFYQAGVLLESDQPQPIVERLVASLKSVGVNAGVGFDGFHRRSARRCGKLGDLTHAPRVVDRTLTLHHQIAIEETVSPEQLAEMLVARSGGDMPR